MIGYVDRIAALLVLLFGLLHLAVGHRAFADPTEARIWFAAGGFLLVTAGLANLAVCGATRRAIICLKAPKCPPGVNSEL